MSLEGIAQLAGFVNLLSAVGSVTGWLDQDVGIKTSAVVPSVFANWLDRRLQRGRRFLTCLSQNCQSLSAPQNHILYRAMLEANWLAVGQAACTQAEEMKVAVRTSIDSLPLPEAMREGLSEPLLFHKNQDPLRFEPEGDGLQLRKLIQETQRRIAALPEGPPNAGESWKGTLDQAYSDLTELVAQTRESPTSKLAGQAWQALAAEFPWTEKVPDFRETFLKCWFNYFSVNFQSLTKEAPTSALLMGKLFHELKERPDAKPIPTQEIVDAYEALTDKIRAGLEEQTRTIVGVVREETGSVKAEIRALPDQIANLLQGHQTGPAQTPERLIDIPSLQTIVLGRDPEAEQLLAALRRPGSGIVSLKAPPGFGKSTLFARMLALAIPNEAASLKQLGIHGIAVLNANGTRKPTIANLASLLGRLTGRQDVGSQFTGADWNAADEAGRIELQGRFFDFLRQAGPIWLVVENAEAVLLPQTSGENLASEEFRALLVAWCEKQHQAKLLLLTRQGLSDVLRCHCSLPGVEDALLRGLPEDAAVQLLRRGLAGTSASFREAAEPLLALIVNRLHRVPLAVEQFGGYLRTKEAGIALSRHWVETNDLLQMFHRNQVERFIVQLVKEHLGLLSDVTRRLLWVLAWAGEPIPRSGILAMAEKLDEEDAAAVVTALPTTALVYQTEGFKAEGVWLDVHPLIREVILGERDGPGVDLEVLGQAILTAGLVEWNKAHHHAAVALLSLSVRSLRLLVEQDSRNDLASDLATAIMNLGSSLLTLGRLEESVSAHQEAVCIRRSLADQEGRKEPGDDLAAALTNLGNGLQHQGLQAQAILAHEEAIEILRRLVEQEGHRKLAPMLALAVINRSAVLLRQHRPKDADSASQEAIAIFRRLIKQDGRNEFAGNLAMAIVNRSSALSDLGYFKDAASACEEAIYLLRPLSAQDGRYKFGNLLACAIMNWGNALQHQGRLKESLAAYEESVSIRRTLVEKDGRSEFAAELAATISCRGTALFRLSRMKESLSEYEESVSIFRHVMEQDDRMELSNQLASAIKGRGNALQGEGRLQEALASYEESISIRRRLMELEGPREHANDLAETLFNRALTFRQRQQFSAALQDAREARTLWDALVRTGQRHLSTALAKVILLIADLGGHNRPVGPANSHAPVVTMNLASTAHPDADPNRAAALNTAFQKAHKEWKALPWLKRKLTPEPKPPLGI